MPRDLGIFQPLVRAVIKTLIFSVTNSVLSSTFSKNISLYTTLNPLEKGNSPFLITFLGGEEPGGAFAATLNVSGTKLFIKCFFQFLPLNYHAESNQGIRVHLLF